MSLFVYGLIGLSEVGLQNTVFSKTAEPDLAVVLDAFRGSLDYILSMRVLELDYVSVIVTAWMLFV